MAHCKSVGDEGGTTATGWQAAKICERRLAPSRAAIRGSGRTAAEFEAVQREQFFADPDSVTADLYPRGTVEGANDGD